MLATLKENNPINHSFYHQPLNSVLNFNTLNVVLMSVHYLSKHLSLLNPHETYFHFEMDNFHLILTDNKYI